MERLILWSPTLLFRFYVDEIVYVKAAGNYSDVVLINGKSYRITSKLKKFEEHFSKLKHADWFVRLGRSHIVNIKYVEKIDITAQTIWFGGKHVVKERQRQRDNLGPVNPIEKLKENDIYKIIRIPTSELRPLKEMLEQKKDEP